MPVVACLACNSSLVIPANSQGRMFKCPRCNTPVPVSVQGLVTSRVLASTRVVPSLAAMPTALPARKVPQQDGEIPPVPLPPGRPDRSPAETAPGPARSFWLKAVASCLALVCVAFALAGVIWLAK